MEIYLIRHTSVDVPASYAYGQTDVPLKPTFEEEAEEVKKGLSDHTFDKVWRTHHNISATGGRDRKSVV